MKKTRKIFDFRLDKFKFSSYNINNRKGNVKSYNKEKEP